MAAGAVELGFRLRFDGLEVPLLAGLETGWFRAHGDGVGAPRTQHPLWFAPFLASGVTYAWRTRWAIGLRLEGARALRRPHFAVENESGVAYDFHRPARIVGRGVLEFELRFP